MNLGTSYGEAWDFSSGGNSVAFRGWILATFSQRIPLATELNVDSAYEYWLICLPI